MLTNIQNKFLKICSQDFAEKHCQNKTSKSA